MDVLDDTVWTIGPFLVQTRWIALFAGGLVGWALYRWVYARFLGITPDALGDLLISTVLAYLLAWKLSPALFDPGLLRTPAALLMTSGGDRGGWVGGIAAALVAWRQCRKHRLPLLAALSAALFVVLPALALASLLVVRYGTPTTLPWGIAVEGGQLAYHPVHLYRAAVFGAAWLLLHSRRTHLPAWPPVRDAVLLVIAGWFAVSLVEPIVAPVFGLSCSQWTLLAAALALAAVDAWHGRKTRRQAPRQEQRPTAKQGEQAP